VDEKLSDHLPMQLKVFEPHQKRRQKRTTITHEMNERLSHPYFYEEICFALKQMNLSKAPGPDGMNAYFYKKILSYCLKDIASAVLDIMNGGDKPLILNHTHVVLFPKKQKPNDIADFRPISLCNVMYKLVTKVISNRLKEILSHIISDRQSAFTLSRMITVTSY